jgi:hypothetical protein
MWGGLLKDISYLAHLLLPVVNICNFQELVNIESSVNFEGSVNLRSPKLQCLARMPPEV